MKKLLALFSIVLCIQVNAQEIINQHLYFDTDSFSVSSSNGNILQTIVWKLQANPYFRMELSGHTDSVGDPKYNLELSRKRVQSVVTYFAERGIKRERIKMLAEGESNPKYANSDAGKPRNRRVDINIELDQDRWFRDGCAKTFVPKGTFDPNFTNEVDIKFFPVTNVAQMRENNVAPTTVTGEYLFSNGMLRVTSTVKGIPVYPKKEIKLRIPAHKMDTSMRIYEGLNSRNGSVEWKVTKLNYKKAKDDCAYYEIDGAFLNRWVNIDKPRPANNKICVDNPFAYLDMPAMDNDSSLVIEDDIILSFKQNTFDDSIRNIKVNTIRLKGVCDYIQHGLTGNISQSDKFLGKNQDILFIKNFTGKANKELSFSSDNFTAFFPIKDTSEKPDFYTAIPNGTGKMMWNYAGKPDSIYSITGCSCKYAVKEFGYPVHYINISTVKEPKTIDVATRNVKFKKMQVADIYVYYRKEARLISILPKEDGSFDIPLYEDEKNVIYFARYKGDDGIYYTDNTLKETRKKWFSSGKVVKKKKFRKLDEKKGYKFKKLNCRRP